MLSSLARLFDFVKGIFKKMDTAHVVVNVKVPGVEFIPNPADGSKNFPIDATAGQTFTLGIPYRFGVGPFTASLFPGAPDWVVVDTDTPGYVTVNGLVPETQPEGAVRFDVQVADSRGTSSITTAVVN